MTLGRVFVDTGAWFALQVQDDEHHDVARRNASRLVGCVLASLVTSNLIVGETYTLLRMTKGYTGAQRFLDARWNGITGRLERLFVTNSVEQQAYQLLQERYAER